MAASADEPAFLPASSDAGQDEPEGRLRSRSPARPLRDSLLPVRGEHGTVVFGFDISQHMTLRRGRQPLLGLPMGTMPSNPQQNNQLGVPFVYPSGSLQLDSSAAQQLTNDDISAGIGASSAKAAVLADLTERGYFVINALRHGFDFIVYEGDPVRHHGSYFVVVAEQSQHISPRQLVLWHRLAAAAHKSVILASVRQEASGGPAKGVPSYITICGEER